MKKAYLSIGFQSRALRSEETGAIRSALAEAGYTVFIFVDTYRFSADEEKQMMAAAFREILDADLLIAETSEKAIGVGIEIGYAAALNKPVLYLRSATAEHSTTASGAAGFSIIYRDAAELAMLLSGWLSTLR